MAKLIFVSLIALALSAQCSAQYRPSDNLTQYLQQKLDSSIVYSAYSNWKLQLIFFVIGQKEGNVSYHTYQRPGFESHLISDTCIHFKSFNPKIQGEHWETLLRTNIWAINYIKKEPAKTNGKPASEPVIFDGDEHDFYFITKNRIRKQYFYAPGFYNTHRPDKNLQTALKAIGILNGVFRY